MQLPYFFLRAASAGIRVQKITQSVRAHHTERLMISYVLGSPMVYKDFVWGKVYQWSLKIFYEVCRMYHVKKRKVLSPCSRKYFLIKRIASPRWFFTVCSEIFSAWAISNLLRPCSLLSLNTLACCSGSLLYCGFNKAFASFRLTSSSVVFSPNAVVRVNTSFIFLSLAAC